MAEVSFSPYSNLPYELTSFIGRERELAEIKRSLATSRLVTLTGAGGCGKTRLAIQIANTIGNLFADGVWLVDLVPLREPALVPQHVAQTLGVRPAPNQPFVELLLNFVRTKQLLLILDNCEHLIAACARLVEQLMTEAAPLNILATSRQPLSLAGEIIYQVQGLTLPPHAPATAQDSQDLMHYDAVHLFVERAQAISPHFTITPENALAMSEICQRLDGLPLALELASARVNVLTPQQIAARLDHRFALLTSGQSTGRMTHHRTLREAIDWSYELLTLEEQTLLRCLAVFEGGFALDTAESVCAGDGIPAERTLDLLSTLVAKSLVVAETMGRAEARYHLLETIREYALEKLEGSGEATRLRDRHLTLFVSRAEEIAPKLQDSQYKSLWRNWLEGELDNIRAALDWAQANNQVELGLRMALALFGFWMSRGSLSEGSILHERLLAQADEQIPVMLHARAAFNAAVMAGFLGDVTAARAHERTTITLCVAAGEAGTRLLALAQASIVIAALVNGDFATAYVTCERLVELLQKVGNEIELPLGLASQGVAAIGMGKYKVARSVFGKALQAEHKVGDPYCTALILSYLGHLEHCEQNYARAQALYEEALAGLKKVGDIREEPRVLQGLAHARLKRDDFRQAHALICESVALYNKQGDVKSMGECLIGFGVLAAERGMHVEATRLLSAGATHGSSVYLSLLLAEGGEYKRHLGKARSQLTAQQFEQAQQEGRSLTLQQAIEFALSLPLIAAPKAESRNEFGGLSEREREIAMLVAQGKTNAEIAARLVVSKRTVEKHIANILSKLDLSSRAQIVRWTMEHGLAASAH